MEGEGLGRGHLVYLSCSYASFGFLYICFFWTLPALYIYGMQVLWAPGYGGMQMRYLVFFQWTRETGKCRFYSKHNFAQAVLYLM